MDYTAITKASIRDEHAKLLEQIKVDKEKLVLEKLIIKAQAELYEKSFEKWLLDNCFISFEGDAWCNHSKKRGHDKEAKLRRFWKESQTKK